MKRRRLLIAGMSSPLLAWAGTGCAREPAQPQAASPATGAASAASRAGTAGTAFDADTVATLARDLAAKPFAAEVAPLPPALAGIDYDAYRDYRFRGDAALWRAEGLSFQAQFFHRGFLFKDRVEVNVVDGGKARPFGYARSLFDFGKAPVPADDPALGFAGFRLHAPLNNADYFDELAVFLGASYFRAVAKGLQYGLSARGLALGSGDPGAEEFPRFRAFWLEAPAKGATTVVVHALLDSPSVAGAYRFAITPGDETVFDVDARLFPRRALSNAGIAPLTSMFEFDAHDRVGIDDFRPAVHDSDGLALFNAKGEQAWRPLVNPKQVEHSGFQDTAPKGFGLMQRKRAFADYVDAEARYERRPSCWVEPVGDWGAGEVHLVEIPTADEFHDNIVAFWRPAQPLAAGVESRWRYRLHWCADHAWRPKLARVVATRAGMADNSAASAGRRLFVIEFEGGRLPQLAEGAKVDLVVSASAGVLHNAVAYRNPQSGTWLASVELADAGSAAVELRAHLADSGGLLSETWLSRWRA